MSTPLQHVWPAKLLSYDYEIAYKKIAEKLTANVLSRIQGLEQLAPALYAFSSYKAG